MKTGNKILPHKATFTNDYGQKDTATHGHKYERKPANTKATWVKVLHMSS